MRKRSLLLGAAASLALACVANATTVDGWYVSLEGGANWIDDVDFVRLPATPFTAEFDTGWAALGSVGYAWSNWRLEFEAGYRDNEISTILNGAGVVTGPTPGDNSLTEVTFMANVLYDIPLTERLSLSLGAGAGGDFVEVEFAGAPPFSDDDWVFAAQGIAGVNYAVGSRTDLYLNYRFLWVDETNFADPGPAVAFAFEDLNKHTATIGLRYHFGAPYVAPPPEAAPPPPPPPPEPAAAPREYIVFFGHNKSNLTAEAMDVVRQAATAAKEYGSATIRVVGHADRSGSARYNQALSQRRAGAVSDALVSEGIARGSISSSAKGESEPMVPTADGVREPQNRRVHITL